MNAEKRHFTILGIGALCFALFIGGTLHLFLARFESGDIYPPYSTLRADPLGTKALFEALQAFDGISVSRHYGELEYGDLPPKSTLLFLGDTIDSNERIDLDLALEMDRFVMNGGRLAFTFRPRNWTTRAPSTNHTVRTAEGKLAENDKDDDSTESAEPDSPEKESTPPIPAADRRRQHAVISVSKWLGLEIKDVPLHADNKADLSDESIRGRIPEQITLHTSLVFSNGLPPTAETTTNASDTGYTSTKSWKSIYERNGQPVVIEATLGKGSIVLSSPSFFVSNEAMLTERQSALILWLLGESSNIVFDETHLGISKQTGVMMLAREHGLTWFCLGLVVLAALYAWQSSAQLVPPRKRIHDENVHFAEGRDSHAALRNLLRQNIRRPDLLKACFDEWKRSMTHIDEQMQEKIDKAEKMILEHELLPSKHRDTQRVYNDICEIMKK